MANHTAQPQDSLLGNLVWEYVPSQADINSLTRTALYITIPGFILLGMLLFGFRSFVERPGWQSFFQVVLPLVLVIIGFFIVAWIVKGLADREKQHQILFYEQGIKDVQTNRNRSARYEELKIWQYSQKTRVNGIPLGTHHSYLIQFPDGSTLRTLKTEVGNRLQEQVCQYQTSQVITAYERGDNVDFGPIRISRQGITSSLSFWDRLRSLGLRGLYNFTPASSTVGRGPNCELIPWSNIKQIEVREGVLYVRKLRGWAVTVTVPDIPNFFVLLNLFRHLRYL
jgi:hypothetical protein